MEQKQNAIVLGLRCINECNILITTKSITFKIYCDISDLAISSTDNKIHTATTVKHAQYTLNNTYVAYLPGLPLALVLQIGRVLADAVVHLNRVLFCRNICNNMSYYHYLNMCEIWLPFDTHTHTSQTNTTHTDTQRYPYTAHNNKPNNTLTCASCCEGLSLTTPLAALPWSRCSVPWAVSCTWGERKVGIGDGNSCVSPVLREYGL